MRYTFLSFILSFCVFFVGQSGSTLSAQENAEHITYSSSEWISNPVLINTILVNQFNDLFPSGKVEVGCGSSKLTFTNGESLSEYLVNGKYAIGGQTPYHLKKYTNINGEYRDLILETLALKLNVALVDDINKASNKMKYFMYMGSTASPYFGLRVNNILADCDNTIGECSSNRLNVVDLIAALKEMNQSFKNGEAQGVLYQSRDN